MTNAEEQRKIFWELYKKFLINNGEPFYISECKQWAIVNKNSPSWSNPCLAMDFLCGKKFLRVNIYIRNDIELYDLLKRNKENLDKGFYPKKPEWIENNEGENTRRIEIKFLFKSHDTEEYKKIIEDSATYVLQFIKNYRPYIEC